MRLSGLCEARLNTDCAPTSKSIPGAAETRATGAARTVQAAADADGHERRVDPRGQGSV